MTLRVEDFGWHFILRQRPSDKEEYRAMCRGRLPLHAIFPEVTTFEMQIASHTGVTGKHSPFT